MKMCVIAELVLFRNDMMSGQMLESAFLTNKILKIIKSLNFEEFSTNTCSG